MKVVKKEKLKKKTCNKVQNQLKKSVHKAAAGFGSLVPSFGRTVVWTEKH